MCGRYRLTAKERYLRDHFGLEEDPPWQPRRNIVPTQPTATIRQHPSEPRPTFGIMRWGLVPYWAKDQSFGLKTINAMSETAAEKPAFRGAPGGIAVSFLRTAFTNGRKPGLRETGVQLQSGDRLGIRVCGTLGPVARREKQYPRNLHDPYQHAESPRRRRARSYAGDSRSRRLRALARPWYHQS